MDMLPLGLCDRTDYHDPHPALVGTIAPYQCVGRERPIVVPTPELDKMADVQENSQAIGEFLDWLGQQGWHIARITPGLQHTWEVDDRSIEQTLAEYFDIDLAKAEKERLAILEAFRGREEAQSARETPREADGDTSRRAVSSGQEPTTRGPSA